MSKLSFNARIQDVVDVARTLAVIPGPVKRDRLILLVWGVSNKDAKFDESRNRLEAVVRAVKNSKDELAQSIYEECYGSSGAPQSILIGSSTHYWHVPYIEGLERTPYSQKNKEQVEVFLSKLIPHIDPASGQLTGPLHMVAMELATYNGYTMGSIAPTIGKVVAATKKDTKILDDMTRLVDLIYLGTELDEEIIL